MVLVLLTVHAADAAATFRFGDLNGDVDESEAEAEAAVSFEFAVGVGVIKAAAREAEAAAESARAFSKCRVRRRRTSSEHWRTARSNSLCMKNEKNTSILY